MYGCRRYRIPVLRNGRPCWQVVVRVAADVGARWCAKGAKASPAWAPWPCLRSAMALRILFIWAWPLAARFGRPSVRGGHSHCAGCARSDALAVASSAPPGAPRAGLAGTLVAPPPAGVSLAVCIMQSRFLCLGSCAYASLQPLQGTCALCLEASHNLLHHVASDPQPCRRARHRLLRTPSRLACLQDLRHGCLLRGAAKESSKARIVMRTGLCLYGGIAIDDRN